MSIVLGFERRDTSVLTRLFDDSLQSEKKFIHVVVTQLGRVQKRQLRLSKKYLVERNLLLICTSFDQPIDPPHIDGAAR
jgi:hypothetical protein